MKNSLIVAFVCFITSVYAQETHKDTLYYSDGLVRVCTVVMDREKELRIDYYNKKGEAKLNRMVPKKDLDQYYYKGELVILKGNNATSKLNENQRTDTVVVYPSNLSINPFSPAFLGINVVYSNRFGENMDHGISIPFRLLTFYGSTFFINGGAYYDFYAGNNRERSLIVGAGLIGLGIEGEATVGIAFKLGGNSRLRERLNLNYYIGVGPSLNQDLIPVVFDAHFGLGFNLGNPKIINYH